MTCLDKDMEQLEFSQSAGHSGHSYNCIGKLLAESTEAKYYIYIYSRFSRAEQSILVICSYNALLCSHENNQSHASWNILALCHTDNDVQNNQGERYCQQLCDSMHVTSRAGKLLGSSTIWLGQERNLGNWNVITRGGLCVNIKYHFVHLQFVHFAIFFK